MSAVYAPWNLPGSILSWWVYGQRRGEEMSLPWIACYASCSAGQTFWGWMRQSGRRTPDPMGVRSRWHLIQ